MEDAGKMRLCIRIPSHHAVDGASITDMDTGKGLKCTSLDLHIDAETRQPVVTLVILDEVTLEAEGTFRFERIGD